MADFLLQYRAYGVECREDYLRELANDNGLPFDCVRRLADRLDEREDFRALLWMCEEHSFALQCALADSPAEASCGNRWGNWVKPNPR